MHVTWDDSLGAFRVTGFEEASAVLRGEGWSSDPARSPLVAPDLAGAPNSVLLFLDPPDHTRLRRLVAPAFSARAVERLRGRVASVVDAALDQLLEDVRGPVDLVEDLGYPVPLAVIAELLDVGIEGAQVFLEQTGDLTRLLGADRTPDDVRAAVAAAIEVTLFLTPVLAGRRHGDGDDYISQLLRTDLTLDEVAATCVLLLAAGHETTANLIANGARALMTHPGQQPALHADPARAVDELLRLEGPVRAIGRTARVDHDLGGVRIEAGQAVLVELDRAGRDPRRWPDPDRLDLTRPGPGNLAFGTGIHFCLGAALARLETEETLTRFFARHPHAKPLTAEPRWRDSTTFHALTELPVSL